MGGKFLADENREIFRKKVKLGKFSTESEKFVGNRGEIRNGGKCIIASWGWTPLFFNLGVKIFGAYYRDVLLAQHPLPVIKNLALEGYSIFQQDSAPAHRAG